MEVPSVMKSKAAILAEEMYEDSEEERMNEGKEEEYLEEESIRMRKVVKGVDGILDEGGEAKRDRTFRERNVGDVQEANESRTIRAFKKGKIVQKVSGDGESGDADCRQSAATGSRKGNSRLKSR